MGPAAQAATAGGAAPTRDRRGTGVGPAGERARDFSPPGRSFK
ncbi:MAG: hypothetical protein AVDCRST_MAG59-2791 [uncultured Thermomicrobiales bacterium]|uniref:Uncharacterized protein n=1 Tax=uncultured Thermomicrobiales bacterium TaxID=1645740 RepID=A0A6J4V0E3_9BACT|nr:MAG: hypothetical protein AVDCRST_MAG59-2791 [uncultured Thermomicrobiales bacterium]